MPDTPARAIALSRPFDHPHNRPHDADMGWQSHLAAGRIGGPAPAAPETVARRTAMIALFDGIRRG